MSYLLQRALSELLLPPYGPFLLLLLAFVMRTRWPKLALTSAALACTVQFGLSFAGLNNYLRAPWPDVPERVVPPYATAEAIVVLGGGRYIDAPEYAGDTAGPSTLERVRYAAKLHRETGRPILVSGGRPGQLGQRSEAEIMSSILQEEFQVPVQWEEGESQQTADNARLSAALLKSAKVKSIYLVTHGSHMARASEEFRQQGLEVVPMATGFERPEAYGAYGWMPSFHGMAINRAWLYEWLARLK